MIVGRRGACVRMVVGVGVFSPYPSYSAPSVVSRVESPPPAGRTQTSYPDTKASHRSSGERTNGTREASVSALVQV